MPFNFQQDQQLALQVLRGGIEDKKIIFCGESKRKRLRGGELEEALDCASPRTSTSTLSSSLGGGDITCVTADLPPIPAGLGKGDGRDGGFEDWENVLPSSVVAAGHNAEDQSFLGWVIGGRDEELVVETAGFKSHHLLSQDLSFGLCSDISNIATPGSQHSGSMGETLTVSIQHQQMQPQLNQAFLLSLPQFASDEQIQIPLMQSHQLGLFHEQPQFFQLNAGQFNHQLRTAKSNVDPADETAVVASQKHQCVFVDQLFQAAELVEAGNLVSALAILTRLNQQLPSPVGKPVIRTAFYFKEALQLLATKGARPIQLPATTVANPVDVVFKFGGYKAFSDISPIVQFTNFTCIQAMLEELGNVESVHIVDFDIGIGGHWPSFMQELAARRSSVTMAVPLLKITAFVSQCSHHPLELHLTRENLYEFARGLNIPFEFNVLNLEPTNTSLLLGLLPGTNEAIAVNLPIGSVNCVPFATLLQFVKQLSPKILVSVEHGSDRSDLPFSHHFLNAFQSCNVLLDSIDAAGTNHDSMNKIERFFVQPRIESLVLGHHLSGDKMLPWRSLFANAGFVPLQFSNFTETQAECILKRVQVRGFHVEKRQASLYLCWQRRDLVSMSAWKC